MSATNSTGNARPAYAIENSPDRFLVAKFASADVRDAWVSKWPDTRAAILRKDIRPGADACRVDSGDCWAIVDYIDYSKSTEAR
jgi:hypothetical protein